MRESEKVLPMHITEYTNHFGMRFAYAHHGVHESLRDTSNGYEKY